MKRQPFGNTGLSVSALGFGGAPIGFLKTDRDRVARVLNLLLDSGVNLIDTAASYKGSEEMIARTIDTVLPRCRERHLGDGQAPRRQRRVEGPQRATRHVARLR